MFNRKKILLAFILILMVVLSSGCFGKKAAPSPNAAIPQAQTIQGTSTGGVDAKASTGQAVVSQAENAASGTAGTQPPKQLENMEYNAASIVFDIIKMDWTRAQERLNEIKADMSAVKPVLAAASVPAEKIDRISSAIDNLDKNIAAKRVHESKDEANQITAFLPDIEDLYKGSVPPDLGRLGYLTREIHINVNQSDWISALNNYEKEKEIWNKLSAGLDNSFKANAEKLGKTMESVGKAVEGRNAKLTVTATNTLLGQLSALEWDFRRFNKH